jgi:hypothetical protein
MHIVLTLDNTSSENIGPVLQDLTALLQTHGFDCAHTSVGHVHAFSCTPVSVAVAATPASCEVCGMADCTCAPGECDCIASEPSTPPAPDSTPSDEVIPPDVAQDVEVAPPTPLIVPTKIRTCRILTLSTAHQIKAMMGSCETTCLVVPSVVCEEGLVRFTYNGFEHVFPPAEKSLSVINDNHHCGQNTIRLVIDIDGKTYPCLVDVVAGEEELLKVCDDLCARIEGAAGDVSREQY